MQCNYPKHNTFLSINPTKICVLKNHYEILNKIVFSTYFIIIRSLIRNQCEKAGWYHERETSRTVLKHLIFITFSRLVDYIDN